MTCKSGLLANGRERARTLLPLAMQKVVGSNAIIRSGKSLQNSRICRLERQLRKPHGHVEVWIVASADDAS
jgi:hypothetical protein